MLIKNPRAILTFAILFTFLTDSFSQNIGVGIAAPDERLHVDSVIRIGKNAVIPAGSARKSMIKFGDADYVYISEQDRDDRLIFRAGAFAFRNGNVGIGIDSATATLDVSGSIRIRNIATAGHVLTSDAQGYATWKPVPANTGFLTSGEPASFGSTFTKVPFVKENGPSFSLTNYDDFNTFNDITNSFTVPATGVYSYNVVLRLNPSAVLAATSGALNLRLFINGVGSADASENTNRLLNFASGQPIPLYISSTGIIPLTAGDVVDVRFAQGSGVNIDLFNGPFSNFSMVRIK